MDLNSKKTLQLEKTLNNFLYAIKEHFEKNKFQQTELISNEIEKLSSVNIESITPSKSSTCKYLERALNNIPNSLAPMSDLIKLISNNVIWYESKRGVPYIFKGGYAFSEIVGDMGLKFSNRIRLGFFLQKPNTNYPLHAHDAEELYFFLSGSADWQIEGKKFKVFPGLTISHESREEHATLTSKNPLFAVWIWTGDIHGGYWFASHPGEDCPIDY